MRCYLFFKNVTKRNLGFLSDLPLVTFGSERVNGTLKSEKIRTIF